MQVAAQPPPLLLACRHQPFTGLLEVGGEPRGPLVESDGVGGDPDLAREVVEEAAIGGAEDFAGGEEQLADRLVLVHQL